MRIPAGTGLRRTRAVRGAVSANREHKDMVSYLEEMAENAGSSKTTNGAEIWKRGREILIRRPGAENGGTWFEANTKAEAKEYVRRFVAINGRAVLPDFCIAANTRGCLVEVSVTGKDAALVCGALFSLAHGPFSEDAKGLVAEHYRRRGKIISEAVHSRWQERLEAEGLWKAGTMWTPELISKRAALESAISLNREEVRFTLLALGVAALEFDEDWDKFCTVVPGALNWYPLGPDDFGMLQGRLKRAWKEASTR